MTQTTIIRLLKDNKQFLKDKYSLTRIGLFGSYSTNTNDENSDIDLVYELAEGEKIGLKKIHELEVFFKKLLQTNKIDLINRKYMNPIISYEMEKTVIYV